MASYDEDTFSDWGELENLPVDTLAELENNAIQFTQAQQPARPVAPSSDYGDDFDDEDLDDNVVIDESRSTPAINPTFQPRRSSQQFNQNNFPQRPASSAISYSAVEQRSRPPPPPRFSQSQQRRANVQEEAAEASYNTQLQEPDAGLEILRRQIQEVRIYQVADCALRMIHANL